MRSTHRKSHELSFKRSLNHSRHGLERDFREGARDLIKKAREAPSTVAAHFRFPAVAVEVSHPKICIGCGALGEKQAVLVGHSLGGGIAMQFAYQFPDRCSGLVLVASGGLGAEASVVLRAASLPGAELLLPAIAHPGTVVALRWASRTSSRLGGPRLISADAEIVLRGLRDPTSRAAFLATLRSVIDRSGQRVSAVAKLAAAKHLPTLLVWGDCDPIIPLDHGHRALDVFYLTSSGGKLTPEQQRVFVPANPQVFVPAPGAWGIQGSTLIKLKAADIDTVHEAMRAAWLGKTLKRIAERM